MFSPAPMLGQLQLPSQENTMFSPALMLGELQLPSQENTIAYILIEDQLRPSLITVDQERESHKPNS